VNCSQSGLAEILGEWIIWLSKIFLAMSELAILGEWTFGVLKIMLAELSFIFLLESIELSLISIEVVIV
jgi:hypothetical protein